MNELSAELPVQFEIGFRHDVSAGYCLRHSHQFYEIVYHKAGYGILCADDDYVGDITPGAITILPSEIIHDQRNTEPGHDVCVHFSLRGATQRLNTLARTRGMRNAPERLVYDELVALSEVSNPRQNAVACLAYNYRVTAVVCTLISALQLELTHSDSSPRNRLAEAAERYIAQHYEAIEVVKDIASTLSVSESYLRHVYKERYGIGMRRRLMQARIDRARELLIHTSLSIKQIALLCGFENEQYFATCFKQIAGATASGLRAERQTYP